MALSIAPPNRRIAPMAHAAASRPEDFAKGALATIILCSICMIFEGFDTYAISYAGPAISREWSLSQSAVGQLYAVAVAASLIGSIAFGILADRFGRKRLLVLATALFGVATILGSLSSSLALLMASRILAGIGLGASIPCAMALAVEAAPPRLRASVPVLMSAAIGGGVIVASLSAAAIMPGFGWRGLLLLGGVLPLILVPPMVFFLRESPVIADGPGERAPWRGLIAPAILPMTLTVTAALFATYLVTFFFGFWMPTLLQPVAPDIRTVGLAMTVIKSFSLVGAITVALLVARHGMGRILPATFLLAALSLVLFVGHGDSLAGVMASLAIASFFVDGAFSGIVGLGAYIFPTRLRATAIGVTIGVARLSGGTAGPMLGGALIDWQASLATIGLIFAIPLVAAALLSWSAILLASRKGA